MTVILECIDPQMVTGIWRRVEPLLRAAIDRTGFSAWQDVAEDVIEGDSLLWVCRDGEIILCAGITSLQKTDFGMVCVIVACGGSEMPRWLPLLAKIEAYAKAEGCRRTRIIGRKGWLQVLDGYRTQSLVMEKEMT